MNMRSQLLHSAASAEPADPVFAALTEFKLANEAFSKVIGAQDHSGQHTAAEKRIFNAAHRRSQKTVDKICRTVPTTVAGVRALTTFVSEQHGDALGTHDSIDNGNIEAALLSVSKAARKLAEPKSPGPATAPKASIDPIFALIAEAEAAHAEMDAFRADPKNEKKDIPKSAHDRWHTAEDMLEKTAPRTLAGHQALCSYILRWFDHGWCDVESERFKPCIFSAAAGLTAGAQPFDPIFALIAEADATALSQSWRRAARKRISLGRFIRPAMPHRRPFSRPRPRR